MHLQVVFLRLALTFAIIAPIQAVPVVAQAQESPEVLLELVPAEGATIQLTRAELEALPQVEFETTTGWTEGSSRYSGPRLISVLELAGLAGKPIEAIAANDYKVVIAPDLIGEDFPIVALRINGEPFGKRDLGPLWIIYPYDLSPEYRSEGIFAASVWQVVTLAHAKN